MVQAYHTMPNNTLNKLTVRGELSNVEKFMKENLNDDRELNFYLSVPISGDIESARAHWGTKWNAYGYMQPQLDIYGDSGEYVNEAVLTIRFQTAWSPPDKWLESVAKKYNGLIFVLRYAEEDFPAYGVIKYVYGNLRKYLARGTQKKYQERAYRYIEEHFPDFFSERTELSVAKNSFQTDIG